MCFSEDFFELVLSGLQLGPSPLDFANGEVIGGLVIKECIVSRAWPELSKLSADIRRFLIVAMGSGSYAVKKEK